MKESDNISSGLSKVKKVPANEIFKVPEGYFDQFQEKLKKRVENEQHQVIRLSTSKRIRPYLAAAASVLILLSIGFFILHLKKLPAKLVAQNADTSIVRSYDSLDVEQQQVVDYLLNETEFVPDNGFVEKENDFSWNFNDNEDSNIPKTNKRNKSTPSEEDIIAYLSESTPEAVSIENLIADEDVDIVE